MSSNRSVPSEDGKRVEGCPAFWAVLRLAIAVAIGASAVGGCSAVSVTASPAVTGTPEASTIRSSTPALAILGDAVQGGLGLWGFDLATGWTAIGTTPDATAIGRFDDQLVLARGGKLELRSLGDLAQANATTTPTWQSSPPSAPVVSLDRSPSGTTAFACSDDTGQTYGLLASDGVATRLNPGPTATFTPQVAWLDSNRLLVLNTDATQISRLSIFDVEAATVRDLVGVSGVRGFAVSGDRKTIAAATQSNVYVGTSAEWLDGAVPPSALALAKDQVVWNLAVDRGGARLAMLSGKVAADGVVGEIHELVYVRESNAWAVKSDLPVPFNHAVGQVWLS